ncbi:NAD(P)-dependent oxidoreductase [Aquabacter sp. L1I39]|uniref:NAD(P)-dependent oxidoreductase n=1 Tax=Aquabacter sp. L1I39 TaxID=2820278 RepID=UPI001ADC6A65|nr:NAD(P)-dependent oxidoreductase [Aquabacter sp. L1I39]QTL03399.1 NAD(P)-dependent oxidoreductase [Aquabacter sp. L1I39]
MTGSVGFIGLGVMGEPMCRNLAQKSGRPVIGFDRADAPLERLAAFGVTRAESLAALAASCDVILMALPSGAHVEAVTLGENGLLAGARPGQVIVDLGTSPVELTRDIAARFAEKGAIYADAPIARTRQAAEEGTLSIMVGADEETFAAIRPLLATFASDITHCGPVGAGQIVKILNNMVLVETVVALSEAIATAKRAGVDGKLLFETLMKGSADSFALRNHGMKAVVPDTFPERAFSTSYARKDISYALSLAGSVGLKLEGAELADRLLARTQEAGFADLYWPVVSRIIAAGES